MNKGPGGSEGETDDCPYLDPSWCKLKGVTVYGNRNTGSNPYTRGISLAGIFNTNQNNNTYTPPTSTGNSWNYGRGNNLPPKEKKTWYFDNDGDGYHSLKKMATTQTSSKWKLTTKGKDCDDTSKTKTTNCNEEPNPCNVTSKFGKNANSSAVNKCSLQKIKEIADELGLTEFEISSTARNATNQARIMFNNITVYGVAKQKALYGSNGDKVIDAYSAAKAKKGSTSKSIKKAMEDRINELGPGNVSKHSANPNVLTVVDIKPSTISPNKRSKFVEAINKAIANGDVSRFLHPGNSSDPAYHIEIKVKPCQTKNCN